MISHLMKRCGVFYRMRWLMTVFRAAQTKFWINVRRHTGTVFDKITEILTVSTLVFCIVTPCVS